MKRPTTLLDRVLLNEGLQVSVAVERDIVVIRRRFEHEGMSFLTIALPSLCDALDQGLALGRITPLMFHGFKPCKRDGKLPALLSGFFMRVFDLDGSLLPDPCICSVRAIRQITRLFKKVELPCSPDRIAEGYERYRGNDEKILEAPFNTPILRSITGRLWSHLESFSGQLFGSPGTFGAGATAERLMFNQRHSLKQWPERGDSTFPLSVHGSHREDDVGAFDSVQMLSLEEEQPVRVVQVPKTLKSPRTISVEPSYMMLRQQSVARPLMDLLESGRLGFKSIRFRDQSINRELARIGSIDGSLATIDLKDASDLVGNDLVKEIFSVCPSFLQYLEDSRTLRAQLPDGSVIKLRKFASMGSALCFPVEAMVFFTLAVQAMVKDSGRSPSTKLLKAITAKIAVYGDDIIVPAKAAACVMNELEAYGLKVNHDKSFYTGFFRESCGGDYFKGHDVTPSYLRAFDFTGNIRESRILSAYVSLSNQFYTKGLWNASQYIRDYVELHVERLARTTKPTGVLTWASVNFDTLLKWDPSRHGWRVKGPRLVSRRQTDRAEDLRAVMLLAFGSLRAERPRSAHQPESVHGKHATQLGRSLFGSFDSSDSHKDAASDSPESGDGFPSLVTRNDHCDILRDWIDHLKWTGLRKDALSFKASHSLDLDSSVRPYALYTKRRWAGVRTGIPF